MNNKILFGNNVGYKITNYLTKKKIIDYLFKNIEIYKLKNNFINSEDDLLTIKNDSYVIFPNIVGDDYLFVCTKINQYYFVVLIEKKTLTNLENINYNSLNIISIRIRLKLDTYKGTIADGRLVNLGGCCAFIINKVYQLYGEDMEKYSINKVHELTEKLINDSYIIDSHMNTILFKLNKIYNLDEIDFLINNKMPNSKFNFSNIEFVSPNESKTYRYFYTNQDIEIKE